MIEGTQFSDNTKCEAFKHRETIAFDESPPSKLSSYSF